MSHKVDTTKYHGHTVEQLSKLHTGTLMNIRGAAYKEHTCESCGHASAEEQKHNVAQHQLRINVQEVLKTREHVKTKAERKADRQTAAKKGK